MALQAGAAEGGGEAKETENERDARVKKLEEYTTYLPAVKDLRKEELKAQLRSR